MNAARAIMGLPSMAPPRIVLRSPVLAITVLVTIVPQARRLATILTFPTRRRTPVTGLPSGCARR